MAVSGVSHRFGATRVLDSVSVAMGRGEILCLLGPSGCGKSTLLRLIAGVEALQEGRIVLDEDELAGPGGDIPPEARAVGLLPQDYALFPHMSVLDNVCFGLHERSAADRRRHAMEALAGTGMAGFAAVFPHQLSGGEQQRVALARALAPRPRLLLLDEPFANLDVRLRARLREETLALLKRLGMTAVIVTHDAEEAMALGDRIALLERGRVRQADTPFNLYRSPADPVVAGFFGELNRLTAEVHGGAAATPFGPVPAPGFRDGERIEVLVRPESLVLDEACSGPGAAGTVAGRRFLGRFTRIDVRLLHSDPGEAELIQVHAAGFRPVESGRAVRLSCAPEDILVFPINGPE
ncbi:MAG: ATP-binding cassette domain-containing protein [Alphaproteobacteria bacterium]|nr:ATP-binding cassette domain-containing protein [Alphaproteobacteria bacterium]